MQHQNKDQAEQLIAEVLVAACLVIENDSCSMKDRNLARRILPDAQEALRLLQIGVYSQAGDLEFVLPTAESHRQVPGGKRRFVMKKRGRQVVLDTARLKSHGAFMTMGSWCKSALRTNLLRAFKILGHPEFC
ncbi:hypothetical protein [Pseudomonas kurunegalensis]|uniref:hypothetical protein n=1 Tax=Pseudomonas kurunegalensis TaxID=485880 RepID=UPI003558CACC